MMRGLFESIVIVALVAIAGYGAAYPSALAWQTVCRIQSSSDLTMLLFDPQRFELIKELEEAKQTWVQPNTSDSN